MQQKMLVTYLVTVLIICWYSVQSVEIQNCGSHWSYENITIENCGDEDSECILTIGEYTSVSFQLNTGDFDIYANISNDVAFYVSGAHKFNLTVTPDNPCDVLKCPLQTDYNATYSAKIYVDTTYPPLRAMLKWIMKTQDAGEQLMCFKFPVILYDYSKNSPMN